MPEPTTRTIYLHVIGAWSARSSEQVSVPWCQTHRVQMRDDSLICWRWAYVEGLKERCELLDPHAPDAIWKDTE